MKKGAKTGAGRKVAPDKKSAASARGTGNDAKDRVADPDRKRLVARAPGLAKALESADRGEADAALEQVGTFLRGADYAPGCLGEAYKLFHAGRASEALAIADRVEARPSDPPDAARMFMALVHSFRGDCMFALERMDDALDAYRKSCKVDATSVASWRIAAFALDRASRSLAREAMHYLPRSGPEVAFMARVHHVDLDKLRLLAENE